MSALQLPRLSSVRDLLRVYNIAAQQQLSQNFLLDAAVCDKIAAQAAVDAGARTLVVEVGPGPGSITRSLVRRLHAHPGAQIVAVEKDARFLPTLTQLAEAAPPQKLQVIHGDILEITPEHLRQALRDPHDRATPARLHVVGNLPFNISTRILVDWLHLLARPSAEIAPFLPVDMTLVFQREVGERIAAAVSSKHYSRLSVMAQSLCAVDACFRIPSKSFVPRPRVESLVVRLRPHSHNPLDPSSLHQLENTLRLVFMHRRKQLREALRSISRDPAVRSEMLRRAGLDPTLRPQDVSVQGFRDLARVAHEMVTEKENK